MFLGIDIGTSEVKALLLDEAQHIVATAGAALSVSRPAIGHSEQNPANWWEGTQTALDSLRAQAPSAYAAVQAIGLSGQMHGAVLLDARNAVLRPAMLWNDSRAHAECLAMMADLPSLPQLSGSLSMPGFTAPKLRWLAQHEPSVFAKVAKVMLPKDYVRLMLTGEAATDMSDASGTGWLDIAKRDWSDALLANTGLTRAHMPRLVEGCDASGALSVSAANLLGLRTGIMVAGGGGDNAASAVGMGAVDAGQGFVSLGTSGVIFLVTPRYQPNPASATHAFCHALPNRWHQMAVMLSAASCVTWGCQALGVATAAEFESLAASTTPAQRASAPHFLPYFSGERTPHNSASLRGGLHGLNHDSSRAQIAFAVMEGVSFGLTDGLSALKAAGCAVGRLSLVGGGARSAHWAQQLASAMGIDIVTHTGSESGGALGAARLGALALLSPEAALSQLHRICPAPPRARVFSPQAAEADVLAQRYETFQSLFRAHTAT